jgi:uncharacterized membrane protein YkoI
MKRAALLLAAMSLGMTSPAMADVRPLDHNNGPAIAAAIVGAFVGVQLAQHDHRDERDDGRGGDNEPQAKAHISPQQAEAAVARVSPGRLLNIESVTRNGRPYYQVRWQTRDGRRVDYLVDGTSGVIAGGG